MKTSAGILMYRFTNKFLEVLLVHPGGPFWKNKDAGAWSIPKGELGPEEDPLSAARREFQEEIGTAIDGRFIPLQVRKLKSGKILLPWALQGDLDAAAISSNTCQIEWPPRSGKMLEIPEVDQAAWMDLEKARQKINSSQQPILEELNKLLKTQKQL